MLELESTLRELAAEAAVDVPPVPLRLADAGPKNSPEVPARMSPVPADPRPQVAQADRAGIAGEVSLSATPTPVRGLRALSREALEDAVGEPRELTHNQYVSVLPSAVC